MDNTVRKESVDSRQQSALSLLALHKESAVASKHPRFDAAVPAPPTLPHRQIELPMPPQQGAARKMIADAYSSCTGDSVPSHGRIVGEFAMEFAKTAAMFAPKEYGLALSAMVFGADEIKTNRLQGNAFTDFGLGAIKGLTLAKLNQTALGSQWHPLIRGATLGVGSRVADVALTRSTYEDKRTGAVSWQRGMQHVGAEMFNLPALAIDAGTFGLAGRLTGYISPSLFVGRPQLAAAAAGGLMGTMSGAVGELTRQQSLGQKIDWSSVGVFGVLSGVRDAGAAALGSRIGGTAGEIGCRYSAETSGHAETRANLAIGLPKSEIQRMPGNAGETPAVHCSDAGGTPALHSSDAGGRPAVHSSDAGGTTAVHSSDAGGTTAVHSSDAGGTTAVHSDAGGKPAAHSDAGGTTAVHSSDAGGKPAVHSSDAGSKEGHAPAVASEQRLAYQSAPYPLDRTGDHAFGKVCIPPETTASIRAQARELSALLSCGSSAEAMKDVHRWQAVVEDRVGRGEITPESAKKIYSELQWLLRNQDAIKDGVDPYLLVRHLLAQVADPQLVNQGSHNSCYVASMEYAMYKRDPERAVNLVYQVARSGRYRLPLNNAVIELDRGSCRPWSENFDPWDDKFPNRSYASHLFQQTIPNIYWQLDLENRGYKPGQLRFIYSRGRADGTTAAKHTGVVYDCDAKKVLHDFPAIQSLRMPELYAAAVPYSALTELRPARSFVEFQQALRTARRQHAFPILMGVNAQLPPFNIMPAQHSLHCLAVSGVDWDANIVWVHNPWGNHFHAEGIPMAELYEAQARREP